MNVSALLRSARIPFLILAPVYVLVSACIAFYENQSINLSLLACLLVPAVLAHVSVNLLNEYHDYKTGLDLKTVKTAFSGGSGALPENPEMASVIYYAGILSLLIVILFGVYFIQLRGIGILIIGLTGIGIILSYTPWINKNPYLCLIAPGVGFGLLMVIGSKLILDGEIGKTTWLTSLILFFLANNLLLLNQFPDIEADKSVGRRHLPIVYGTRVSSWVYLVFLMSIIGIIIIGVRLNIYPDILLISLMPVPLGLFAFYGAFNQGRNIGQYPQYPGANVLLTILMPVLLAIALLIA